MRAFNYNIAITNKLLYPLFQFYFKNFDRKRNMTFCFVWFSLFNFEKLQFY